MKTVNKKQLEKKVKEVYRMVAEKPHGKYHFELGRKLAEKLGYPKKLLDKIPKESVESFAGVGYHFHLANIQNGERVLDLGSGSGMDVFFSSLQTHSGAVIGIDFSHEQLQKAKSLKGKNGFSNVTLIYGNIANLPFADESIDVVVSNGVINLSPEKGKVFKEIARVLKKGGKMAISDIVSDKEFEQEIVCDTDLWASCIGGAMQKDKYKKAIESAGLKVRKWQENFQYEFLSESARDATKEYGVKSISILAIKN